MAFNKFNSNDPGKDKRISFLSLFSSLCNREKGAEIFTDKLMEKAFEINEELYKKYPYTSNPSSFTQKRTTSPNKASGVASKCPQCNNMTLYHNKGISAKNGEPWENYKCRCGYISWVDLKAPQHQAEDTLQDEAKQNYGGEYQYGN